MFAKSAGTAILLGVLSVISLPYFELQYLSRRRGLLISVDNRRRQRIFAVGLLACEFERISQLREQSQSKCDNSKGDKRGDEDGGDLDFRP